MWGMFMALPDMIQRRIEFLDSVTGFLMSVQDGRKRAFQASRHPRDHGPLEYKDLAPEGSPLARMFGDSTMDRDDVIDIIASQMATPEGKKLYNKLISNKWWAIPGLFGVESLGSKWNGPIIGKSISSRILNRRKEILEEANEKMRRDLSKRLKELYAEGDYEKIVEFAQSFGWDPANIEI